MVHLWELQSGDVITSFPIWPWKLFSQPHANVCRFVTAKLTGKYAQLFLRHQNTTRLTFDCHCAILAVWGNNNQTTPSSLTFIQALSWADHQSSWGKTCRHHSQHLPQAFGYCLLPANWSFFFHCRLPWASSCYFPQTSICGKCPQNPSGVCLTCVQW